MESIIEEKCAGNRVPTLYNFWCNPIVFDKEVESRELLETYSYDTSVVNLNFPDVFKAPIDDENYRWVKKLKKNLQL